jgi:uncharacterized protein
MPDDLPALWAGAALASFATGAAGFGDALILAAIWLHVLSPQAAVPLIVATGAAAHVCCLAALRRRLDFSRLWPFLVGGFLGVPLGVWFLGHAEPQAFRAGMGVFLVVYGATFLLLPRLPAVTRGGAMLDGAVGGVGGVLGGLAGLSGFVPAIWCGQRGWTPAVQRGVTQPFILAMHGLTFGWLVAGGFVDRAVGVGFLWCLPAVALGLWLGLRFYGRLDAVRFRKVVLALLTVAGALLLVGAETT